MQSLYFPPYLIDFDTTRLFRETIFFINAEFGEPSPTPHVIGHIFPLNSTDL